MLSAVALGHKNQLLLVLLYITKACNNGQGSYGTANACLLAARLRETSLWVTSARSEAGRREGSCRSSPRRKSVPRSWLGPGRLRPSQPLLGCDVHRTAPRLLFRLETQPLLFLSPPPPVRKERSCERQNHGEAVRRDAAGLQRSPVAQAQADAEGFEEDVQGRTGRWSCVPGSANRSIFLTISGFFLFLFSSIQISIRAFIYLKKKTNRLFSVPRKHNPPPLQIQQKQKFINLRDANGQKVVKYRRCQTGTNPISQLTGVMPVQQNKPHLFTPPPRILLEMIACWCTLELRRCFASLWGSKALPLSGFPAPPPPPCPLPPVVCAAPPICSQNVTVGSPCLCDDVWLEGWTTGPSGSQTQLVRVFIYFWVCRASLLKRWRTSSPS